VRFQASLTPFRHLGFFPDMAPQWDWMRERSADADVLNLFGYTGVGTLLLSEAGARLVHVDASKKSVEQGKANAALSGFAERPIRWLTDDATKFAAREVRRGRIGTRTRPSFPARTRKAAGAGSSTARCRSNGNCRGARFASTPG